MSIEIRHARSQDQGFIISCLLNAARKNHFYLEVNNRDQVRLFKQHIADIVTRAESQPNSEYQVFIIETGGKHAGVAILTPLPKPGSGREIYALALRPEYRGRGLGSQTLDWLLDKLQKDVVVARCAPASKAMYHLLSTRGFETLGVTDEGFQVLQRDNLSLEDLSNV